MTWNHRVIRHDDGTYGVHEVYYDDDGKPQLYTANPVAPFGESLRELKQDAARILCACYGGEPILTPADFPKLSKDDLILED